MNKVTVFFTLLILVLTAVSCTPPPVPWTGAETTVPRIDIKATPADEYEYEGYDMWENRNFRPRREMPSNHQADKDSLWSDESAWGNFFRDKKARFIGDLLQITNIDVLIANDEDDNTNNPELKAEIGEVESKITQISSEITNILPNGNLEIYGQKITFKDGDSTRFITTIKGYIRQEDINGQNEVDAMKIARSEIKTTKGFKIYVSDNKEAPPTEQPISLNSENNNLLPVDKNEDLDSSTLEFTQDEKLNDETLNTVNSEQ